MTQVSFTPEAYADLRAIALHIAEDNPVCALSCVDEIEARCRSITEFRTQVRLAPNGAMASASPFTATT